MQHRHRAIIRSHIALHGELRRLFFCAVQKDRKVSKLLSPNAYEWIWNQQTRQAANCKFMDLEPRNDPGFGELAGAKRRPPEFSSLARQVKLDLDHCLGADGQSGWDGASSAQVSAIGGAPTSARKPQRVWLIVTGFALVAIGAAGGVVGVGIITKRAQQAEIEERLALEPLLAAIPSDRAPVAAISASPTTTDASPPAAAAPAPQTGQVIQPTIPLAPSQNIPMSASDMRLHKLEDMDLRARRLTSNCEKSSACHPGDVARANQLAEDAYAAAIQSGVPAGSLIDVRRGIDALRKSGLEEPLILVGNYAVITHQVAQLAASRGKPSPRETTPAAVR